MNNAVFRIRMDPGFFADTDLKVRIRPIINDGFDKVEVLEEPDQKEQS